MMRRRPSPLWLNLLKWFGSATGVLGALLIASNVGAVGWGFILFALSSTAWAWSAAVMREPSLVALQTVFLGVDLVGIWRWHGG